MEQNWREGMGRRCGVRRRCGLGRRGRVRGGWCRTQKSGARSQGEAPSCLLSPGSCLLTYIYHTGTASTSPLIGNKFSVRHRTAPCPISALVFFRKSNPLKFMFLMEEDFLISIGYNLPD